MYNEKKVVSIIVPAYNVENYIDRCIESIIAQTYTDIEILIVDDGSTDSTWSHIHSFAEKDQRIRGFKRENAGVSSARNFALSQMKGQYVQFVDADDYLRKDAVETLVNAIESSDASWVNCQYNRIDENNNPLDEYGFTKGLKKTETPEERFHFIRDELLEYYVGYEVWNKLYLASIIMDNRITFDEECHLGEDLEFNICYSFYAASINCIEDRLYYYLVRSNSAMENAKSFSYNFKEHLALSKGIESRFSEVFNGDIKNKYYQLFYKLMLHACFRHTAVEAFQVAKEYDDDFYKKNLDEALKHKEEFSQLFHPEMAMLFYRYGLYINTYLRRDLKGKIYFKFYNLYRKLRKRETIEEWSPS